MPTVRNPPTVRSTSAKTTSPVRKNDAVKPKKAARNDGFETNKAKANSVALHAAMKTIEPALMRTLFGAAGKLGTADAHSLAAEAFKAFAQSPEMMAAFRHAQPALLNGATALGAGKIAKAALPFVVDGKMTKALLEVGMQVGGRSGKRLVAAAMRGLKAGGLSHSAAELAATAAKIGAKTSAKTGLMATVGKGLGKALPIIGNAANILSVATSLKGLVDVLRDPNASGGDKLARILHVAATVAGCFIPVVGVAGDLALAGVEIAKK